MNKKSLIIALILLCIVLFIILLGSIVFIMNNNAKEENENINTNSIDNRTSINSDTGYYNQSSSLLNENSNSNTSTNANTSTSTSTSTHTNSIFNDPKYDNIESNGTDSNLKDINELIKNMKISLANVNKEVQNSIIDKDSFIFSIKKYLYEQNLLNGDTLTMISYLVHNEKIEMFFEMNNKAKTKLSIIYDPKNNSTKLSRYQNDE